MDLASLIQTVGFPIAVSAWLLYEHRQVRHARREERQRWRDALDEQTAAIENQTDVLRRALPTRPTFADDGRENSEESVA